MQTELKAKDVSEIIVFCVNDGAVMKAWATEQCVQGSMITFMGDPHGHLTERLGMGFSGAANLGYARCKRCAVVVDDCVVKAVRVSFASDDLAGDNDPEGPLTAMTRAPSVLALL
mmetsp:Transcript_9226/g.14885  ORF Transcript_9226/g.14885 Transcript_9226/m.14885 type:complete len:115 (+) Transcript_9226:66-410(+)